MKRSSFLIAGATVLVAAGFVAATTLGGNSSRHNPTDRVGVPVRYILTGTSATTAAGPSPLQPPPQLAAPRPNGPDSLALQKIMSASIPTGFSVVLSQDQPIDCGTAAEVTYRNAGEDRIDVVSQCLSMPVSATSLVQGNQFQLSDEGSVQWLTTPVIPMSPGVGQFFQVIRADASGGLVTVEVSGGPNRLAPLSNTVASAIDTSASTVATKAT